MKSSPAPVRSRSRRALGVVWACFCGGSAIAGLVAVACSSNPSPRYFDGSALGSCTGFFARPIEPSKCEGCSGSAYALCNGNTFNECTCEVPSQYSTDAGLFDTGAGPPLTGLAELGDATPGQYPCCTGKLVFEIPASSCPARCEGEIAYAVCVDDAFTACSCHIPDGYTFSDLMCDAGDY